MIDIAALPEGFPTHLHLDEFWQELGRTIATYGFLEETLGKAIFAFTAVTEYQDDEVSTALEKWQGQLEKALTDPLGAKIQAYESAVKAYGRCGLSGFETLILDLRKASHLRNALCHASWRPPDQNGASRARFFDRKFYEFETAVDVSFLNHTRRHVVELAMAVVSSVTSNGWQFPGSNGPGEPIWRSCGG
ncbi:hypothetical protein [Novosphingobium aquimarinum]|uniref:hypothetical protein n=1 Tax=Novosphingobium aquimarinum TaxID=2682494 RepID=UPI0012EB8E20|nr:hypothetical protein [Novosphingobium aquimarinum]